MDPKNIDELNLPRIEGQVMRKEGEEKKGAGFLFGVLSKLGLKTGLVGEVGALGGLMATNAGIVGLVLVGTTIAAGTGMFLSLSRPARVSPNANMTGILPQSDSQSSAALSAGVQAGAPKDGTSASLDYVAQANRDASGDGAGAKPGEGAAADSQGPTDSSVQDAASGAGGSGGAGASGGGSASVRPPSPMPGGRLVRAQGIGAGGGGGTAASASAGNSIAGANRGGARSPAGSGSAYPRSSVNRPFTAAGKRAAQQAAQALRVTRGNLKSGNVNSPGAGLTYDGGRGSVGVPGIGAAHPVEGAGLIGSGVSKDPGVASTAKDIKDISKAPKIDDGKNKTPYQKYIIAAIAALAIGMICLLLAGHLMKLAHAGNAAMLLPAQILAGIAAAAGVAAAACGAVIWTKYEQMGQGLMFVMAGGVLAFQAAKVLMDSFAGEHAQKQIDQQVAQTDKVVADKLNVPETGPKPGLATEQLEPLAPKNPMVG